MSSFSPKDRIALSPIERTSVIKVSLNRPKSFYSQISNTKSAKLKCQFCLECFDLYDIFNDEKGLSTFTSVSVSNDSNAQGRKWAVIGRTYIVMHNANPQYHEKEFEINDVVLDAGYVLIQTYALHPSNGMPVCIGTCQIAIKEMLHSDTVIKRLKIGSLEKGTVVVYMKAKKESKYPYVQDIAEYCSLADCCLEDNASQMSFNEEDYKNTYFKDILGNINRQRYHFNLQPQYQRSLRLCEEMYELATSFNIPAMYIRLLCEREHANMLILQSMVEGFSEEVSSITAVSRSSKISQYRDELAQLGQCSKHSFKKSEWKGHSECKWAPVNLHAQVLEVNTLDQRTNISSSRDQYSLLTVGAMAGHWDKFKNGGLVSLLGKNKDGEKFAERRELYRVLQKIEGMLNSYTISDNMDSDKRLARNIVSDLITLSKEPVTRTALERLQRTLHSDKQLEIMNLSADLEKIVKSIKVTSKETVSNVCRNYCLHSQRALVWSIAQLELDNREHFLNLLNRFEACFSQLLSSLVSGLIVNLCFRTRDMIFQQQLRDLSVPVMLESLLSTHGDEYGMLEDMQFVIQHTADLTVQLERSTDSDQVSVSRVTGTQFHVTVIISLPGDLLDQLPDTVQNQGNIQFIPLFFSHGINEQQTIAYKINETRQQDRICEQFLEDLQSYIDTRVYPNMSLFNFKVENSLTSNMEKLRALFRVTKRDKCSDFIVLAEQIGRDVGCIRFTSCKSAKDRTSMSITYEYCNILCKEHDFQYEDVPPILEQFRRDGTRYHNTFKNIGSYKYCFNKLQCKMLPAVYKPPPSTFGDGAQQS